MDNPTECSIVLTTVATPETAQQLTTGLLEQHLAACVQQLPIHSTYRWKDAIQSEPEILLLIKTQTTLYPQIETYLRTHHPYEVPQIIRLPIAAGSPDYLSWLAAQTQ